MDMLDAQRILDVLQTKVAGHFAERHFADGRFAERTFPLRTFCRTNSLPNRHLAENRDIF
jgi:hypothetical protein